MTSFHLWFHASGITAGIKYVKITSKNAWYAASDNVINAGAARMRRSVYIVARCRRTTGTDNRSQLDVLDVKIRLTETETIGTGVKQ